MSVHERRPSVNYANWVQVRAQATAPWFKWEPKPLLHSSMVALSSHDLSHAPKGDCTPKKCRFACTGELLVHSPPAARPSASKGVHTSKWGDRPVQQIGLARQQKPLPQDFPRGKQWPSLKMRLAAWNYLSSYKQLSKICQNPNSAEEPHPRSTRDLQPIPSTHVCCSSKSLTCRKKGSTLTLSSMNLVNCHKNLR